MEMIFVKKFLLLIGNFIQTFQITSSSIDKNQ